MKPTIWKKLLSLLLALSMVFALSGCELSDAVSILEQAGEYLDDAGYADNEAYSEDEADSEDEAYSENETYSEDESADSEPIDSASSESEPEIAPEPPADTLDEFGEYTSAEDVALYIHQYGHLPDNFITKSEAKALGWEGGSLEKYAPGKSIGGDRFGNREKLLPDAPGRSYTECDIDTLGKSSRGAKRIVFSNDGLVYYTEDHYESFTLLYGEE